MMYSGTHVMSDIQELWSFRSFRARIFFAIVPTVFAVLFGYFAMDRTHPYDFIGDESAIIPPSGHGGEQIIVVWRVVYHRTCTGIVERQLVDITTGVIIAAYDPSPAVNGIDASERFLRKTFLLPKSVPTGWIGYQAKLTYTCNWLQAAFPGAFAIRYQTPRLLFRVEP